MVDCFADFSSNRGVSISWTIPFKIKFLRDIQLFAVVPGRKIAYSECHGSVI